jgi:hypothetical protein
MAAPSPPVDVPESPPFPIDMHASGKTLREWYEVGEALVLLTGTPELLRLERRGLARRGLPAVPRVLAEGDDRLMLAVGGDSIAVLDADGKLSTWPRSTLVKAAALDEGWWLIVPDHDSDERVIELRRPDGGPRVGWKRRFAPTARGMPLPRRFGDGWLVTNLTDVRGATQALTLFDASLRMVAASAGALPAERELTPIDARSFWAAAEGEMERWVRKDGALVRLDAFPSRASWWTRGHLVTETGDGVVACRDADGVVRWVWHRDTTGATGGVVTRDGVLVHDEAFAHLLDLEGRVQKAFEVESPVVRVAREGTVYLKSRGELWTVDEDAHASEVDAEAKLETTCGGEALLRRPDGSCLLVGKDGNRLAFHAQAASLPPRGTRGGPWLVEGDRIRGRFGWSAHAMAEAVAIALSADASGAVCRELPSHTDSTAFGVVLADGCVPVLVRQAGTGMVSTTGPATSSSRSWHIGMAPAPAALASVSDEVVAAVKAWLAAPGPHPPTLAEIALEASALLSAAFDERWTVSLPGTPDPREMAIHPPDRAAAHVGVFPGRLVMARTTDLLVRDRGDVSRQRDSIVAAVREQRARYKKNLALSDSIRELADALASRLSLRFSSKYTVSTWRWPSYEGALFARISDDARRAVVDLTADEWGVRVHAGAPGELGWAGQGTDADAMTEPIALAIERMGTTLTVDRLVPDRLYRVIGDLPGASLGDILRFQRIDEVDNHHSEYVFVTGDGRTLKVGGDFSTPEASPLAEVHRLLEEA